MDSLKVLVVDDEYLVRELIKRTVPWETLGLTLVSEASGGREALDEVEKHQPDIIITDICMPIMDGIEFSRTVLEKYPQIKIVVLTGHDEFNYARDSVSIGIREYLLKPIDPNQLTETLVKITSEIHKDLSQKREMKEILPLLQEKVLNDLLSVRGLESDIYESLEREAIKFKTDLFQVALIDIKGEAKELYSKRKLIFSTIKEYFINMDDYYCFAGNRGFIAILSHGGRGLNSLCDLILNNIVNRLGESIVIGIGREVLGIENISISYDEASKSLDYQVVEGVDSVIQFEDIERATGYNSTYQNKMISDLAFTLKAGLEGEVKVALDELFRLQIKSVGGDINSLRVMAGNILSMILSLLSENDITTEEIFPMGNQPYEVVFTLETLEELIEYFTTISITFITLVKRKNSKKTGQLITGVKRFVRENIGNPELNLSFIADQFNVNASYLSRKFKQETGSTFMVFLSKLRIEVSIELLKTTDLRSYEISEKVGVNDPHYFSVFFKKQVGLSISDYKKELIVKN